MMMHVRAVEGHRAAHRAQEEDDVRFNPVESSRRGDACACVRMCVGARLRAKASKCDSVDGHDAS
jgi:hypothetical protein